VSTQTKINTIQINEIFDVTDKNGKVTRYKNVNGTLETAKLYRLWWSDGNDRDELCRVKAFCMDDVEKLIQEKLITPDTELDWVSGDDEYSVYDLIPKESESEKTDDDDIYSEEYTESISVELEEKPEPVDYSLKLIDGSNQYYDLTTIPPTKAPDWNPTLNAVWSKDPQKGVDMLQQLTLDDKLPKE
jgi:hypothetical protein